MVGQPATPRLLPRPLFAAALSQAEKKGIVRWETAPARALTGRTDHFDERPALTGGLLVIAPPHVKYDKIIIQRRKTCENK
jgi:hypothetical protein